MMPSFAVVGHPNKGKSSVVATLVENASIAISRIPGTTYHADEYILTVGDKALYQLIDTPGFQRPGAVLNWLKEREDHAAQRKKLIEQFVQEHDADDRFHDECTLLRPVLQGAGILYVVDGSKPYAPEFEIEMQVLQWTGQPRMALINLVGDGDYVDEWRTALGQYFSIVREFDAMKADFEARTGLLRAFGELHQPWATQLHEAIDTLTAERQRRLRLATEEVIDLLSFCLTATEEQSITDAEATDTTAVEKALTTKLMNRLRARETQARQRVQRTFHQDQVSLQESQYTLVDEDLFTEAVWRLFGLSKTQLIATGGVTGALAGGSLDLAVGGTSFMLGSLIGATVGSVSAWLGGEQLAKLRLLGTTLGGQVAQVGPVARANFPWVLLGRAIVHLRLVSERNHALRTAFVNELMAEEVEGTVFNELGSELRRELTVGFSRLKQGSVSAQAHKQLASAIQRLV